MTEDFECEIELYDDEQESEEDSESDDEDDEEEEDLPELLSIHTIRVKALCNPNHVCISGSHLLFQVQVVNPQTNVDWNTNSTIQIFLQQENEDEEPHDVGMGQVGTLELEKMDPNIPFVEMLPYAGSDCHQTGMVCG